MSNSSPDASPNSASAGGRHFSMSMSKDQFMIDIPSPRLQILTNGHGNSNGNLGSPNPLKSPNARRLQQFSREGIIGSAQKARNLSQSSVDRESMTNGIQNQVRDLLFYLLEIFHNFWNIVMNALIKARNELTPIYQNQNRQTASDDGINPLKRRSTDAGIDYPRRRATIAVSSFVPLGYSFANMYSVKSVVLESHDVTERNRSASSAPNWALNASIVSQVSNLMLVINSSWST
jgi:hypothetical protein